MASHIKKLAVLGVAGTFLLGGFTTTLAQDDAQSKSEDQKNIQTTCPVTGEEINKDLYVEKKGKRIYVCCKGCISKVKKNPGKYIKKLEANDVDMEKMQTHCPVMGGKINKDLHVDAKGKRIYVCCQGCVDKVKENPEKYIQKLKEKGVTLKKMATCNMKQKNCPASKGCGMAK